MPGPNVPFPPQEALLVDALPTGERWQYEPKWDGFRGILENDGGELALWSRNGRPLLRYFPELRPLGDKLPPHSALDGEIVIEHEGKLQFDLMQLRLHPAESRIKKLSAETPATFIAFDVLLWDGAPIHQRPLAERRVELERVAKGFTLSPYSRDRAVAEHWLKRLESIGLDGVIAKKLDLAYMPGSREAVFKVKHHRTADCVIIGYRLSGKRIATLLLGLYRDDGTLDFVGHTSGIPVALQKQLQELLPPLAEAGHLTGERVPGAESRWSQGKDLPWVEVRPKLVCEVRFDKMEADRFRHGTRFMRFRPDKEPRQCTWDQVTDTSREGDPTLSKLL
ncbi:MAG TPA: ATP-dependent DNA ligase, partial [Candidatus Limnocylindria bacterium]|nr:ATP-dependent DNA ligase [Candidatus Limnocylindria bacterium]